jgi:hypothetical protein
MKLNQDGLNRMQAVNKRHSDTLQNLDRKGEELAKAEEEEKARDAANYEAAERIEEKRQDMEGIGDADVSTIDADGVIEADHTPRPGFRQSPAPQSFLRFEETMAFAAAAPVYASGSIDGVFIASDRLMSYFEIKAVDDLKDSSVMIACLGKLGICMNDENHRVAAECKALYSAIMYDVVTNATAEIIISKIRSSQFIENELRPLAEKLGQDNEIMSHMASLAKATEMIQRRVNELAGIRSTYIGVETLALFNSFDRDAIEQSASGVTLEDVRAGRTKNYVSGSLDGNFMVSDTLMTYCDIPNIEALSTPTNMINCISKLARCMNDNNHRVARDCRDIYKSIMYDTVTNAAAEIIVSKIRTHEFIEKELALVATEGANSVDVMEHMASLGRVNALLQQKLNELIGIQSTFIAMETLGLLAGFDARAVAVQ